MPERVGFWLRSAALAIDLAIFAAVMIAVGTGLTIIGEASGDAESLMRYYELAVLLAWLAYTSTEIFLRGTPAELMLGLRIARSDGVPADFWRLFLRWSTKHFPSLCALLFALSGVKLLYLIGGFENSIILIGCFFAANDD